jgi:hypothetical protein
MIANKLHPVRPLIGRFRPLRGDIQPPVCGSRGTLSNYLIKTALSRMNVADLRAQKNIRPVFRLLQGSRRRAARRNRASFTTWWRGARSRLFLPARSLRGRPGSLRTVLDGVGDQLRKRLIWRGLLVVRPATSGVGPIFLPALREGCAGLLAEAAHHHIGADRHAAPPRAPHQSHRGPAPCLW